MPRNKDYARAWRQAHPEKQAEYNARFDERHPGVRAAQRREAQRRQYRKWKLAAFEVLGGRCAHCGLDDPRVLQVDHVEGGGSTVLNRTITLANYRLIVRGKGPPMQLLCANCHQIKTWCG